MNNISKLLNKENLSKEDLVELLSVTGDDKTLLLQKPQRLRKSILDARSTSEA
jgi:hypothetical protein